MIITKAPLRISFAGGGTDLREFYKSEVGSVTSASIDKYVYVAVHKYFENKILLKYSKIELVDKIDDIQNELFRECLRYLNITKGVEITTIADLPSRTGLGSSSSFAVALLHALHAYKGESVSQEKLAKEAAYIEVDVLKRPIGKQDHYGSAIGGLKFIEFHPDEHVAVTPLICKEDVLRKLNSNLLLFYTGTTRGAEEILSEQKDKTEEKRQLLRKLKNLSERVRDSLINGDLGTFPGILHDGWSEKKKIVSSISNASLDDIYQRALNSGASGGKVLGAGGGGFILLFCEREKQDKLRLALQDLKEVNFKIDPQGSRIVYVGS